MPSFTRSGLPVARDFSSLARRSASRMISAEPFLRYVSCSSTGAKVGMRKAIIRNAAARSLTAEAKIALEPCELVKATKIHIRKATAADAPRLREVIEASVRGLQAEDYSPAQMEGALKSVYGVDSQLIADGTYLVAEILDSNQDSETHPEIVGCGGWSKRKTLYGGDQFAAREDSLLDPARDAARIRAFFVHPS